MLSLITPKNAQRTLAEQARARRLQMDLTQQGLAERSGVALPTLRKFERTGSVSLLSFLKLQMVLGGLEEILKATQISTPEFSSIDEVLKTAGRPARKRGKRR
jgi:transcriptional regulator with XRE-family HTH domain